MEIFAHRGASAHALENTLEAFSLARRLGADGVELDVRRCGSGEVVVFHDADLGRLAGVPLTIADTPLAELRRQPLKNGEAMPTLAEVLEVTGPLSVNVELKVDDARPTGLEAATIEVIRKAGAGPRVFFSSFHPAALWRAWRLAPELPRALLFGSEQSTLLRRGWHARGLPLTGVHPEHVLVDRKTLEGWWARSLTVRTWTVNEPAEARRLATLGVDAIITDRPQAIRDAVMGL